MPKHAVLAGTTALLLSVFTARAEAQPAPPPGQGAPPPGYAAGPPPGYAAGPPPGAAYGSPPEPPGVRTHDGFFLRLGLNLGYNTLSETVEANGQEVSNSSIRGGAGGFDLLFGGTPAPGLVLGGGLIQTYSSNPTVEINDQETEADGTLLVIGAVFFVNYYFDPSEGLHLQGSIGYGAMDFVSDEGRSGSNDPTGPLFSLGLGYDFWVGDQWSIGPFARVLYANMGVDVGAVSASESYLFPSIGAAFTLH
jgi:hypothetical protein